MADILVPRVLAEEVLRIERDLKDFDGDLRGHLGALKEAEEALIGACKAAVNSPAESALSGSAPRNPSRTGDGGQDTEDDGTAERAAEIAAGWIARAWYRKTHNEGGNGGEIMLSLAAHARENITPDQWKALGGPVA